MTMTPPPSVDTPCVLLFDGDCKLCHGVVRYVARHNHKKRIHIQSLQSYTLPFPKGVTFTKGIPDSVLVQLNATWYDQSEAILKLMMALGGWHRIFLVGYIIPKGWRDALYRWISRHRHTLFGNATTCKM
jgi:predicted DCC family thiol-disulfide oxidoreductase YuxK